MSQKQFVYLDQFGNRKGTIFGSELVVNEGGIIAVWEGLQQIAFLRLAEGEVITLVSEPTQVTAPALLTEGAANV